MPSLVKRHSVGFVLNNNRISPLIAGHKGSIQFPTPVDCQSPAIPFSRDVLTGQVELRVTYGSAIFTSARRGELHVGIEDKSPEAITRPEVC